ncbi:hypothetical protein GTA08_BOTSDO13598 [Botryosphaeria dothidea]|uniref:Uncharacterized protein n=1 Tax=Botryosphaeria dothidea TaxID=55169 RepID=A0A8H4N9L5_9PEZI|nr:hypothetical protein GTA08_BOTSDO13598 [Botryosphaeria dothidea]
MGWWWRSDPQRPVTKPSEPTPDPVPTSSQPPASPRDVTDKPTSVTRDEQADAELKALLSELQASVEPSTSSTSSTSSDASSTTAAELKAFLSELQASVEPSTSSTSSDASSTTAAASSQTTTPSIFPTTMNCRQAFDEAFYCQSLGGQFMNVYRYGSLRSCSDNWADFWFCMRVKSYGEPEKSKVISEHYRQKETKYRRGPSSEDVWEERKPGEELKNPFSKDPDEIEIPGLPKRRKQAAE